MKTILIDDDLYSFLLGHTQKIGESASSILRRLLGLKVGHSPMALPRDELLETFDFLKHWEQFRHLTLARKFLHILAWIYRKHPETFERALSIEGTRRKYFAQDLKTLLNNGNNTNPRPIPESPYWVVTNNSTAKKSEILAELLRLLGYKAAHIEALIREFGS